MTIRITKEWKATILEAFGDTPQVRKGQEAEDLYEAYAIKVYEEVINHQSDQVRQSHGIDFEFKKPTWKNYYSVDVKGNMLEDGTILIDNNPMGWLRNPNKHSHRICHICPQTQWAVEYDREIVASILGIYESDLIKLTIKQMDEERFMLITDKKTGVKKSVFRRFKVG